MPVAADLIHELHEIAYSPPQWMLVGIFIILVGVAIGHLIKIIGNVDHDKSLEVMEVFLELFLATLTYESYYKQNSDVNVAGNIAPLSEQFYVLLAVLIVTAFLSMILYKHLRS